MKKQLKKKRERKPWKKAMHSIEKNGTWEMLTYQTKSSMEIYIGDAVHCGGLFINKSTFLNQDLQGEVYVT